MADLKDPSEMTDEELDEAILNPPELNEDEPEEEPDVTKEEPEAPEVPEDPKPDPAKPDEGNPEEDKPPSRREQLRIQQVLSKLKETQQAPPTPKDPFKALDYENELDASPELIAKLKEDRDRSSEDALNRGQEQTRQNNANLLFHTRLEIDAPRVESKYKFLDKDDKTNFNPVAASAMNQKYLQFVGFDPNTGNVQHPDVRYSDFVEAEMEFADEIANSRIEDSTKNIKKQAAQTGLRPDGSGAKKLNLNKEPEDMTDEELDAVIARAIPTR